MKSAEIKELARYDTQRTVTSIKHIASVNTILICEASMFGFDWTGKVRLITDSAVVAPAGKDAYQKAAWATIEYEHGVCSADHFVLPSGVFISRTNE